MKAKILNALSRLGVVQQYFQGKGVILMLHRVSPLERARLSPNENMKVSPEFLESFIIQSKNADYHFLSLDELHHGLIHDTLPSPFLCFTLDDGWRDNLSFAAPIFEKHNIPFCVYVCTSFPESSHNMWWYGLEDFLLKRESMEYEGRHYALNSHAQKEAMFLRLRAHIIERVSSYEDCQATMAELGIAYNPRQYDALTLNWEEIQKLARIPRRLDSSTPPLLDDTALCTIGCHTHSHPIFNNLTLEQITQDIAHAQELFHTHLGAAPKHFAYPFGSRIEVDSKHFALIETLGFHTATTTRHGCIYPRHKEHLSALPRVFFGENFSLDFAYRIRRQRIVSV